MEKDMTRPTEKKSNRKFLCENCLAKFSLWRGFRKKKYEIKYNRAQRKPYYNLGVRMRSDTKLLLHR